MKEKQQNWLRQVTFSFIILVLILLLAACGNARLTEYSDLNTQVGTVPILDDQGIDELDQGIDGNGNSQVDLTSFSSDTSTPGTIEVGWTWDNLGGSGANSSTGCVLLDTDSDGEANYAVCNSVVGDPFVQVGDSNPEVYKCDTIVGDVRCNGSVTEDFTVTCSSSEVAPAFSSDNDNDTNSSCTIIAEPVVGTNINVINVCSYSSEEPSSEYKDCVLTPGSPPVTTVTVTLTKVVIGDFAPSDASFQLTLDCDGAGTDLQTTGYVMNNESITVADVPVGSICTASETGAGDDWETVLPANLTVTEAGTNTLEIVNTYVAKRTVELTKEVVANVYGIAPDESFELSLDCDGQTAMGSVTAGGSIKVEDVPVGSTCIASETDPGDDWVVDPASLTISLTVSADGDNKATITNTYDAKRPVTLTKLIAGSNPPTNWMFDITLTCEGVSLTATVSEFLGSELTINDVPVGATCTASEADAGTDWVPTILPDPLTVSGDGTNTISITNEFVGVRTIQGCTPGYWRQSQHFDSWAYVTPNLAFSEIFGDITITTQVDENGNRIKGKKGEVDNPTLLQAVWAVGGGDNALARHAVAAYLNTINPEIDYQYSIADVLALYEDGNQNALVHANEQGCPLN